MESVVSQQGRPDDGTDAAGFFNAEFFVPLKPENRMASDVDKDGLTDEMLAKLQAEFPGVEFNFSQYLQDNVAEAVSGVKGENSIKLFGNDLQVADRYGGQDQIGAGHGSAASPISRCSLRSASRPCRSISTASAPPVTD